MLRGGLFILSLFTIAFFSCSEEKAEPLKARSFYDSINNILYEKNKAQQELIDQLTESMLALKENSSLVINTKPLSKLLEKAIRENSLSQKQINEIKEVDPDIGYKKEVMAYLKGFEQFYELVPSVIKLFGTIQEGRGETISNTILPTLQEIKNQELALNNIQRTFERKYPVDEKGNIITDPDFEYIRLVDFDHQKADIQDGEALSLLSYSGIGRPCSLDTIYYVQFIGIMKESGDTVRILSACQSTNIDEVQRNCNFESSVPGEILDMITSNNTFIVFNKNQASLEKQDFKTAFGNLEF